MKIFKKVFTFCLKCDIIYMRKRTGKFYSRNEKQVMKSLGFTPAPASGAGWVVKEDGENDLAMVQLKSTDGTRYTLDMLDMKKLEYHAAVSHKIPIFVVEFLKEDRLYAIVPVDNIVDLKDCVETGKISDRVTISETEPVTSRRVIKAGSKAREQFYKEREQKYGRK